MKSVAERLLSRYVLGPDFEGHPCWLYSGSKDKDGYGYISINNRTRKVHRVAHEEFIGPIPTGHDVHHRCNRPACIQPCHIEALARRGHTHLGDTIIARNLRKTHCPNGHPLSPDNLIPSLLRRHGFRSCLTCRREFESRRKRDPRRRKELRDRPGARLKAAEYAKAYRTRTADRRRATRRAYYLANRERLLAKSRAWQQANRVRRAEYARRRRAEAPLTQPPRGTGDDHERATA